MELQETPKAPSSRNKLAGRDPERSKRILIDATLDTLASDGLSDTTVSKIVARAGLSRGMIHLHFGGKDKLVSAAAEAFARRYYDEIDRRLEAVQGQPRAIILTIVEADLSETILNERTVSIWHAMRGATRFNDYIAKFSDTRDTRLRRLIYGAFQELHEETDPDKAHEFINDATLGTLAILEGMWTDYMVHPNSFNREAALRIVTRFLSGLFPEKI